MKATKREAATHCDKIVIDLGPLILETERDCETKKQKNPRRTKRNSKQQQNKKPLIVDKGRESCLSALSPGLFSARGFQPTSLFLFLAAVSFFLLRVQNSETNLGFRATC